MLNVRVVLQAMKNLVRSSAPFAVALLLGVVAIKSAHAHIIDRIEINQAGDEAEIQIIFDVRIQFLRQATLKNGDLHLFFKPLEADPSCAPQKPSEADPSCNPTPQVPEVKDSPPSDIVPHFRVAYPELDSSLSVSFDQRVSYRIRPGKDGRSISIFTPVIKPESVPMPVAVAGVLAPGEVEGKAKQLIDSARDAIKNDQVETAIEILNQLLNLPPNKQSQDAQRLIGEAREANGDIAKARAEYELYLKIYPDAKDVNQVQSRLARLPTERKEKVERKAVKKIVKEDMTFYGSLSQSYYHGVSHTDATENGINQTFDTTDQSTLISSLDLTGRKRTEKTDTRIAFRDDYRANFLSNSKNDNRLSTFYVEQSARDRSYLYRLGRQSGVAGGVPGRFDGAWAGYSPNPVWRLNAVVGTPVELFGSDIERKTFAGVSVDLTRLPEQWSGSGYFIAQRVGKVMDRQAFGMEAHYFDAQRNYLGLLEYDRLFKAVDIAMFQGNWSNDAGDNYTLLADHRKAPSLQITNALPGQTVPTIAEALTQPGVTQESLRDDAKALTPTSNLFMVGMTRPFSSRFRLGGDFRITNTSGTDAAGMAPALPGTGNIYIISAQAIGNNLLFENDLGLVTASLVHAPTYNGQSLVFNQVESYREHFRMDFSLQLYRQNDSFGVHQTRITPSLKLSYRMNETVSFDGEGGIENTHDSGATKDAKITRKYFYIGYRWEFR
jgi:tetratricopeptide (TPR) repeat protein